MPGAVAALRRQSGRLEGSASGKKPRFVAAWMTGQREPESRWLADKSVSQVRPTNR